MDNRNSLAGSGQVGRIAPPPTPGPSLEDRLEHLQRAVERLCKLRAGVEAIAERLGGISADPRANPATPNAPDLGNRFGETIGHVHANLDQLEYLTERIYGAMFSSSPTNCASPARG